MGLKAQLFKFFSTNKVSIFLVCMTGIFSTIVLIAFRKDGLQTAKEVADTFGGIGTTAALFWIIGGYFQQRAELSLQRSELALQREELKLQRQAHQQQVEELRKQYKLQLIQELARMLADAHTILTKAGGKLSDISQMGTAVLVNQDWKVALESTDPFKVIEVTTGYFSITGKVVIFIHTLAAAAKMYFSANSIDFTDNADAAEFVYVYSPHLNDVYPFREYIGPTALAAQFLFMLDPGIKALKFAAIAAAMVMSKADIAHIDKLLPDYIFLRDKDALPAIGKKVAHLFEAEIKKQNDARAN